MRLRKDLCPEHGKNPQMLSKKKTSPAGRQVTIG